MNLPNLQLPANAPLIPGQNSTGPTQPGTLAHTLGLGKLYPTEPDPTYTLANQGYAAGADAGVMRGLAVGVVAGVAIMYLMKM
jgi:hypothetical protein